MSKPCPCKSGRLFLRCCGRYVGETEAAPTAEALMRSRYTAFTLGHIDYLLATQHPSTQAAGERASLQTSVNNTQWVNLTVISTQKGKAKDKIGIVEFTAAYRSHSLLVASAGNQVRQMHERSHFIKEKGQWLYTEGEKLPLYQPKRSDLCWCGSGKKFKQCHG